jgi:hypothetical protein
MVYARTLTSRRARAEEECLMSRIPLAIVIGLAGFAAYVAGAVVLADRVVGAHWLVQLVYFLVAGMLWTLPARWLMLWSVRQR